MFTIAKEIQVSTDMEHCVIGRASKYHFYANGIGVPMKNAYLGVKDVCFPAVEKKNRI